MSPVDHSYEQILFTCRCCYVLPLGRQWRDECGSCATWECKWA